LKLCERFDALQRDFWCNDKDPLDGLSDSELGDLQEYLSLRNAGFSEDEIRSMAGEELFDAVQATIARIRENVAPSPATKHKNKSKRRVEVCDHGD